MRQAVGPFNVLSSNAQWDAGRPPCAAWIRTGNNVTQQFLSFGARPDVVSLAGGLPAPELYPMEAVRAATDRALTRHGPAALEYGAVEGLPALRELIAQRVSAETGGRFTPDHVLLTTGAMQGLDLLGKVFIDAGDTIVVQCPTYLGALDAWRARVPTYARLDWDLRAPGFSAALRRAKFVYTVPNYSNPTGVLVSQSHRAALLDQVLERGTWLIEDDPYHVLQFDAPAGRSILHHCVSRSAGDYAGPVIYLGTVSKSLVPGLRVGWIIAEPNLIQTLALVKQSTDLSSSLFTQAVTFELLQGDVDREHAKVAVAAYRQRRDALCRAASQRLGAWLEWEVPSGGMFVWMHAKNDAIDTNELYRFALDEKVAFVPSSVFDFSGEDRFAMRVNFTRVAPDVLVEGVERLARAIVRYLEAAPGARQRAA
jgi:2-aminoadipate transaminase